MRHRQAEGWRTRAWRVLALAGTLVLHLLVIAALWRETAVRPAPSSREAMTVWLEDQPATSVAPAVIADAPPAARRPDRPRQSEPPAATMPALPVPETEPEPTARLRIDVTEAAREYVEANRGSAPANRQPWARRNLDATLPGGSAREELDLRVRPGPSLAESAARAAALLGGPLPSAATDFDAMADPLFEMADDQHHGDLRRPCRLAHPELSEAALRALCDG